MRVHVAERVKKRGGGCEGQEGAGSSRDLVLVSIALDPVLGPVLWGPRALFCSHLPWCPPHLVGNLKSQGNVLI